MAYPGGESGHPVNGIGDIRAAAAVAKPQAARFRASAMTVDSAELTLCAS